MSGHNKSIDLIDLHISDKEKLCNSSMEMDSQDMMNITEQLRSPDERMTVCSPKPVPAPECRYPLSPAIKVVRSVQMDTPITSRPEMASTPKRKRIPVKDRLGIKSLPVPNCPSQNRLSARHQVAKVPGKITKSKNASKPGSKCYVPHSRKLNSNSNYRASKNNRSHDFHRELSTRAPAIINTAIPPPMLYPPPILKKCEQYQPPVTNFMVSSLIGTIQTAAKEIFGIKFNEDDLSKSIKSARRTNI